LDRLTPGVVGGRNSLAVRVGVDHDDGRADLDGRAGLDEDLGDNAGEGARQLDERLGGLDLDDVLVDGDLIADGDAPLDDVSLGQTFTGVGEAELFEGGHGRSSGQWASVRSTASSTRS